MSDLLEDSWVSNDFLAIDTPLGDGAATLVRFEGEEALSRCFLFEADIVTPLTEDAIASLLAGPVTLWVVNGNDERRRPFNGNVRRVIGNGVNARGEAQYRLEIVPRLWFLGCTSDCRIFQNLSIPDILRAIFQEHGVTNFDFRLHDSYAKLEYCVQYQETALAFASRLMEHLGLFYWHEHYAKKHVLVIADSNNATPKCSPFTMSVARDTVFGELHSLRIDHAFRPGKWTLGDYDFESPSKHLVVDTLTLASVPQMAKHEMYEYPGHFKDSDAGRWLSRLRIELEEAQLLTVHGTGSAPGFDAGRRFRVRQDEVDKTYLLTRVRHRASWLNDPKARPELNYENDFTAIPADTPYRPERATHWPFVRGVQTATVVGPAGEQIFCDEYGRVRVQFHWDRRGQRNEHSSCWMRVAQSRSGAHYGSLAIPHVGHEVLVSFIEGDPDRPLITGTVPNAITMPAVPLPAGRHKTVQRDHGDNKIVMHGKAGEQHLSLSSPRGVNMFATGSAAQPLSSGVATPIAPPAAATGSLMFHSAPTAYNLGNAPAGSVAGQGAGTGYAIPPYMDGTGLSEVWTGWYGTVQSDADNSEAVASTTFTDKNNNSVGVQGSYGTQDGTVADSYLNWGSEGKINCVALGNMNNWLYADANTWVNGNSNTQVNGNSTSVIGGTAYGGMSTSAVSTTTIYGTSNTVINGPSNTNITGVSTTIIHGPSNTKVFGANASTVLGDNTSTTVGNNNSFNFGVNLSLNLGLNVSTNVISDLKWAAVAAKSADLILTDTPANIRSAVNDISDGIACIRFFASMIFS